MFYIRHTAYVHVKNKTKQATRSRFNRLLESGWWRITIIIVILRFNFALDKAEVIHVKIMAWLRHALILL